MDWSVRVIIVILLGMAVSGILVGIVCGRCKKREECWGCSEDLPSDSEEIERLKEEVASKDAKIKELKVSGEGMLVTLLEAQEKLGRTRAERDLFEAELEKTQKITEGLKRHKNRLEAIIVRLSKEALKSPQAPEFITRALIYAAEGNLDAAAKALEEGEKQCHL